MALGYTLRSEKFVSVEDEMITANLLPLLKGYYLTFCNNTSIISSLNFLQISLSTDLGFFFEGEAGDEESKTS